jgi:PAS domain S-box-containing protein
MKSPRARRKVEMSFANETEDSIPMDESRFRLLVEGVMDYAIYMLDPAGNVVSWSRGAERFTGYTAKEIVGKHFSVFHTESDRRSGLPMQALATARSTGKFEAEGWRVRKDGTHFWAHVVMDPIWTSSGIFVGFAKITRDLSERRAAEQTLRRSQEELRLLVQSVTDYAIYMVDRAGNVTNWNAGAERIKGYTADEIVGQHFSRFYTEEDREAGEPARALEAAAREGRLEKEGWRVRKDGTRFWANVVIDPVRDMDGAIIGFAKVTRDITERRNAQIELEKAREALFHSQKMESIGQLTGGVAHDFNNLLSAILGSLELLRKRTDGSERADALIRNAMQATKRGAALTQRMLAFARKQDLKPEPTDIVLLVDSMTDLLDRTLGPSVSLETRFARNLGRILVDRNQLEMALLNLATNARDAMPSGGTIRIDGREEIVAPGNRLPLSPGKYVRVSVTDQGQGMDPATLARATEPFFTTKGVGKGTGLGLSMVHGLAEQSGGRLELQSQPGAGTTASLWLPIVTAEAGEEQLDGGTPDDPGRTVRRLEILAVDDDALVLLNIAAMLEDVGHSVTQANSGSQAMDALGRQRFDLVITDQGMPHMTGIELIEKIRRDFPDLPVLLATGFAELPPGAAVGVPRLSKPFLQADLVEAVTDMFPSK